MGKVQRWGLQAPAFALIYSYDKQTNTKEYQMTNSILVDDVMTDGKTKVYVGNYVGFKNGVEQYGRVEKISNGWIHIEVTDGETGEDEIVQMPASSCWFE